MFNRGGTGIGLFESTIQFQVVPGFYLVGQRRIFNNTLETRRGRINGRRQRTTYDPLQPYQQHSCQQQSYQQHSYQQHCCQQHSCQQRSCQQHSDQQHSCQPHSCQQHSSFSESSRIGVDAKTETIAIASNNEISPPIFKSSENGRSNFPKKTSLETPTQRWLESDPNRCSIALP